jgi:(p)ppGpp synthase/HD superfamily hydrolase
VVGPDHTLEFAGEFRLTRAALEYAHELHHGQRRQSDGAPFIAHPVEVASLLFAAGARDDVVAAGVLHDTLEKTAARPAELSRRFGEHVARLVSAVSEDESIRSYARRKAALRKTVAEAGPEALTVFAADKLSKARELRSGVPLRPAILRRRLDHYNRCLLLLQQRLENSPLVTALEEELRTLQPSATATRAVA